ncbi:hypothetical protein [Agrococcus carbonis]|uniref:Alpha/beta hydrolase family protein n=1 Tax=Agrococcus carbonis TaxID=684552 RepID=A0A1H1QKN2_9MICO|nr:hypothetical protein [Agrococcus carbonis]SDS24020.1 hypothetical protein SAMN04489719_1864 [Agrococcus carbonis]
MTLEPLTGHWPAVEGHGDGYLRTAEAIERAIEHLAAIRDEDATVARSIERVRESAAEVAAQLDGATSRYATTGRALVEYADDLRLAQARADDAIDDWREAAARAADARAEQGRLASLDTGDDASAAARTASALAEQQRALAAHAAAMAAAEEAWRAARDHKEEAAELAAARIRDEIAGADVNDSLWDDVRGAITDAMEAVEDALLTALRWLGAVVLVAAAALVAAALAIALIATGLIGMLLGGLLLLTLATWVAGGGAEAFVATLVRTGSLDAALVAGTIGWLRGTLPWAAAWLVDGDRGAPVLQWSGALEPRLGAAGTAGDHLARLQADNRAVDAHAGGPGSDPARSSMVAVTAVTAPGGETVWRVSVPSTQQWLPGTESINDLHADAAVKLGDTRTQLERAVVLAMEEAGVPEGASVLLSGWSLGGIVAAELAADAEFASTYDVDGVIVAGSSIDDIRVPTHVPMLSFEHSGGTGSIADPVPLTEDPSRADRSGDPNRTVVRVAPPAIAGVVPHHALGYQQTMQEQGDLPGSSASTWMALHDLDRFFVGVERPHASVFSRGGDG